MIRTQVMLALVFFALLSVESSVLWAFENWLSAIPLMMIAGFLVLQRVGMSEGVAWFLALAILRGDIVAGTIALCGPLLTTKVFSTRSLYALFGVGLLSHAMGILVFLTVRGVLHTAFDTPWTMRVSTLFLQECLLIPGLFIGMSGMQWFYRTVTSRVTLKPLT